jgi:hypothetical protein
MQQPAEGASACSVTLTAPDVAEGKRTDHVDAKLSSRENNAQVVSGARSERAPASSAQWRGLARNLRLRLCAVLPAVWSMDGTRRCVP